MKNDKQAFPETQFDLLLMQPKFNKSSIYLDSAGVASWIADNNSPCAIGNPNFFQPHTDLPNSNGKPMHTRPHFSIDFVSQSFKNIHCSRYLIHHVFSSAGDLQVCYLI
jgi:hypothetical protein